MADNWYLRLDKDKTVVHGFSDDFEKPLLDDVLFKPNGGRHFRLDLVTHDGFFKYKWQSGRLVERTEKEIAKNGSFHDRQLQTIFQEELTAFLDEKVKKRPSYQDKVFNINIAIE